MCTNIPGSYICDCHPGYQLIGDICIGLCPYFPIMKNKIEFSEMMLHRQISTSAPPRAPVTAFAATLSVPSNAFAPKVSRSTITTSASIPMNASTNPARAFASTPKVLTLAPVSLDISSAITERVQVKSAQQK